jgi:hypothetical protein
MMPSLVLLVDEVVNHVPYNQYCVMMIIVLLSSMMTMMMMEVLLMPMMPLDEP